MPDGSGLNRMSLKLNGSTGSVIRQSIVESDSPSLSRLAWFAAPETNGFDIQANNVSGQWGVHPMDNAKWLHDVILDQWIAAEGQSFLRNPPRTGITA
jgi:hypothetical protein